MNYSLEEDAKHGEVNFPIGLYKVDFSTGPAQILPCHWHDEYELIYILDGSAIFRIEDTNYSVIKGDIIIINGGELHSAVTHFQKGCIYIALVFKLNFLNSMYNDHCKTLYINPLLLKQSLLPNFISKNSQISKDAELLINSIIDKLTKKSTGYELFVKGSLLMLISLLFESSLIEENAKSMINHRKIKTEKIKKVLDYISINYQKRINIDELALICDMNRYNFCRFFKNYIDMTPVDYINQYRVNEAARLLQSGKYTVTDAALQTGFDTMSYFSKIFRKYQNISPSKLKRTIK